jgi:hypothetical protein
MIFPNITFYELFSNCLPPTCSLSGVPCLMKRPHSHSSLTLFSPYITGLHMISPSPRWLSLPSHVCTGHAASRAQRLQLRSLHVLFPVWSALHSYSPCGFAPPFKSQFKSWPWLSKISKLFHALQTVFSFPHPFFFLTLFNMWHLSCIHLSSMRKPSTPRRGPST